MVSKKKARKTQSAQLAEDTLPKKGPSTFSVVDGMGDPPPVSESTSVPWKEILDALKADKEINITLEDQRGEVPQIIEPKINVQQPAINIDVKPTPVEVRVPTQRIPPPEKPEIHFNVELAPIVWAIYVLAGLVAGQLGIEAWRLLTSLNLSL